MRLYYFWEIFTRVRLWLCAGMLLFAVRYSFANILLAYFVIIVMQIVIETLRRARIRG